MCDSYVIRIYSKTNSDAEKKGGDAVGIIESPDSHWRIAFHDKDELWEALLNQLNTSDNRPHDGGG